MRLGVLSAALLMCAAPPLLAAPDFSRSEILVSSESPLEAEVVTFTVVLRNGGPDDAGSVSLMVEWPLMGFFVDASGFDAPQIDHEARQITDAFALAAGGERRFTIRVLAPRDSGGDGLTLAYRAAHYASSTEHWDRRSVTIDTRVSPTGLVLRGYRVTTAASRCSRGSWAAPFCGWRSPLPRPDGRPEVARRPPRLAAQ